MTGVMVRDRGEWRLAQVHLSRAAPGEEEEGAEAE
jgi:hypothetical protein